MTLASSAIRKELQRLHVRGSQSFWQESAYVTVYFTLVGVAIFTWYNGLWPVTLLCWGIMGHIGHMNLIAFHEASHRTLHPNRLLNETMGILLGTIILTPLSVYRWVHNQHHSYLGTPKDTEMWPFVIPTVNRAWRLIAATGELCLGFFYTPIVFLHGYLIAHTMPRRTDIRIRYEYLLIVLFLITLVTSLSLFQVWGPFVIGYLIPSMISGNLQTVRKFTEHLGLFGDTLLTKTRTVVPEGPVGKLLSESMMHIDYHGTHHRFARIPHYNLPQATPYVYTPEKAAVPIYKTYAAAMWDMAKSLGDPRVGHQWKAEGPYDPSLYARPVVLSDGYDRARRSNPKARAAGRVNPHDGEEAEEMAASEI